MASRRKCWAEKRTKSSRIDWNALSQDLGDLQEFQLDRQTGMVDVRVEQDQGKGLFKILGQRTAINESKLEFPAKI